MQVNFADIKAKPWLTAPAPPAIATMLNAEELKMLEWMARERVTGAGAIIDAGAFLGGSTRSLAAGLRSAGKRTIVHSYDLFVAGPWEATSFGQKMGFGEGDSTLAIYKNQIAEYLDLIEIHEGDITTFGPPEPTTELLFIDVCKTRAINDHIVRHFFPTLVPGRSIVIQQDFLHFYLPWLHITMEKLAEHFEVLCDTEYNSVVFGCIKAISASQAEAATWNAMTGIERMELMDRAISRWDGQKRAYLQGAKASYDILAG